MKKSELKEIIKPIVKECVEESVREIVLESGLLASVINEVVKGTLPLIADTSTQKIKTEVSQSVVKKSNQNNELLEQLRKEKQQFAEELKQQNKSLSMKIGSVDVFKDTKPAPAEIKESVADPLAGVSPNDPGVDISRLFGNKKFTI